MKILEHFQTSFTYTQKVSRSIRVLSLLTVDRCYKSNLWGIFFWRKVASLLIKFGSIIIVPYGTSRWLDTCKCLGVHGYNSELSRIHVSEVCTSITHVRLHLVTGELILDLYRRLSSPLSSNLFNPTGEGTNLQQDDFFCRLSKKGDVQTYLN